MDTMTHYITVVDDNVEAGYAAATAVAEVLGYVTDVLGTATIQHKGYRVVLHASSRHFASVKAEDGFWYRVDTLGEVAPPPSYPERSTGKRR